MRPLKKLAPEYEAVAEALKDLEILMIVKFDATTKEVEETPIHSFTTLKFFPAGADRP